MEFSAAGFFVIQKSFLIKMLSVLLTYEIILVQFHLGSLRALKYLNKAPL
jgi:hypothetical protein